MKFLSERIEIIFSHSPSNVGKKSFGNTSAATAPYKKKSLQWWRDKENNLLGAANLLSSVLSLLPPSSFRATATLVRCDQCWPRRGAYHRATTLRWTQHPYALNSYTGEGVLTVGVVTVRSVGSVNC
jgi:hypothetical protein